MRIIRVQNTMATLHSSTEKWEHINKDNGPEEQADHGQVGRTCAESFQPAINRVNDSKVDYQQLMTLSLGDEDSDGAQNTEHKGQGEKH